MSPELAAAVENAYREFARYRPKGAVYVCHCAVCVDAETERKLHTVPLRQMSSQLLAEYTHSAHGWDDRIADEFRYFLPRYFELISAGDPPTNLGLEACLDRLHEAKYRLNWPRSDADAVDRYFLALFRDYLARPVNIDPTGMPGFGADPVEEVLCMVAHADGDLAGLLTVWDADRSRMATLRIAAIVSIADWRKKRLENSSWYEIRTRPHVEVTMQFVIAWLLRPETRGRLEAACLEEKEPAAAALLSHAEGLVGAMI